VNNNQYPFLQNIGLRKQGLLYIKLRLRNQFPFQYISLMSSMACRVKNVGSNKPSQLHPSSTFLQVGFDLTSVAGLADPELLIGSSPKLLLPFFEFPPFKMLFGLLVGFVFSSSSSSGK
jgi:hypothetical protein